MQLGQGERSYLPEGRLADQLALSRTRDLHLLFHAKSVESAVAEITRFYANYRSQRYVDGELMLRIKRLPPEDKIAELGRTFKGILGRRGIRASEPSKVEIDDEDELDCERLAVHFNQSSFGLLRRLIDELNRY